jgi:hypothetical protein
MKRKLYTILMLSLPLFVAAQKTNPAPYCVSEFNNNYNMINSISVGAYTHSFGVVGTVSAPNTYLYVDTAKLPPVSTSASTSVLIDFYSTADVEPAYFAVWIDYNQNNAFEATEMIMHNETLLKSKLPSGSASGVALPLSLTAPTSAKPGKTRMRIVRGQKITDPTGPYDAAFRLDPCYAKTGAGNIYGCTYDFDVTIYSTGNIDEQQLRAQLSISPNPASDKILISNTSAQKIQNLLIVDLSGKKVFESQANEEINISHYAPGIYFVKLTMESGAVVPLRLVKN